MNRLSTDNFRSISHIQKNDVSLHSQARAKLGCVSAKSEHSAFGLH